MHVSHRKCRLFAALQPADTTDPTYTGADGCAYQPAKFVGILSAPGKKHVAAPYHYQPDGHSNPMLNLNPCLEGKGYLQGLCALACSRPARGLVR